ncbi:hypothetical protein [Paraburkholderia heleia]|uniref:hypothetical protein n=1 Tax=Paraburkholderia heleia TaxID=634127 RepID=UPI0031DA78DB
MQFRLRMRGVGRLGSGFDGFGSFGRGCGCACGINGINGFYGRGSIRGRIDGNGLRLYSDGLLHIALCNGGFLLGNGGAFIGARCVRGGGGLKELIDARFEHANLVLKIHASFSGKTRDFTRSSRALPFRRCTHVAGKVVTVSAGTPVSR